MWACTCADEEARHVPIQGIRSLRERLAHAHARFVCITAAKLAVCITAAKLAKLPGDSLLPWLPAERSTHKRMFCMNKHTCIIPQAVHRIGHVSFKDALRQRSHEG
jgi:hypothetical protein